MKKTSNGFYAYSKILSNSQMDYLSNLAYNKIIECSSNIKNTIFDINPKVINNKGKRLRESEAKNDFKKANEQYQRDTDEKDLINIIPQSYIGITLDLFYESLFEDN
jgi:triacylglycerol esterase/lipase EstA (alpha/beta hydrolase family)